MESRGAKESYGRLITSHEALLTRILSELRLIPMIGRIQSMSSILVNGLGRSGSLLLVSISISQVMVIGGWRSGILIRMSFRRFIFQRQTCGGTSG